MDLIPVMPRNEMEANVTVMYRTRLPALFEKIKPRRLRRLAFAELPG